jgi:hypothetical protein
VGGLADFRFHLLSQAGDQVQSVESHPSPPDKKEI